MWIVMSSSAHMPNSVKAPYRNVAIVRITNEYANENKLPKMISTHAKGVVEVKHYGKFHSRGKNTAFHKAMKEAELEVLRLNN